MKTKPGTANRIAEALAEIHKFANSDAEPGCLSYRLGRSGDDFLVFHKCVSALECLSHDYMHLTPLQSQVHKPGRH